MTIHTCARADETAWSVPFEGLAIRRRGTRPVVGAPFFELVPSGIWILVFTATHRVFRPSVSHHVY